MKVNSIEHPLARHARERPNDIAVRDASNSLTWESLWHATLSCAAELRRHSSKQSPIMVAGLTTQCTALPWIHACLLTGTILAPVDLRSTAPERLVVAKALHPDFLLGGSLNWHAEFSPAQALQASIQPNPVAVTEHDLIDLDAIAFLIATSGTSGTPKCAALTAGNFAAHARASQQHLGLSFGNTWLAAMPLHHVGGLSVILRSAFLGSNLELRASFDATEINKLIDGGQVTHISVVPTMLVRLLDDRGERPFPKSLALVLVGGAALPTPLANRARAMGAPVAPTYGLTEACSQVATQLPSDFSHSPCISGHVLPDVELTIRDSSGQSVAAGHEGEIWVRGNTVMRGYWPALTGLDSQGWFRTGDWGVRDAAGLRLVDRRTDLVITGGENVSPSEVEDCLRGHPAVADCAVVGLPDETWGARVVAVLEGPNPVGFDELKAFCSARLAPHKVPKETLWVSALPRTAGGKIRRAAIRESLQAVIAV